MLDTSNVRTYISSMSQNEQKSIHLQGIGRFTAKPAEELKAGDVMVWNFGYTSTVLAAEQRTPKTITVLEKDNGSGKEGTRRFRVGRLVAVEMPRDRPALQK